MFSTVEPFIETAGPWLAAYYAVGLGANAVAAARCSRRGRFGGMVVWSVVAAGFAALAARAAMGRPAVLPEAVKQAIDAMLGPATVMLGSFALFAVLYLGRSFFVRPGAAWSGFNLVFLAFGASLADRNFAGIVCEPDNGPIVAMVFLLGFFTWLGARQAVENDRLLDAGDPPRESQFVDKVFAWPKVVYLELIGLAVATTLLIAWSLLVAAPLEGPADPGMTPNPSKAPWYFVGLQEMLVYFDPWLSGVTIPALIVLGLMAIPYLDFNPEGNGYYTIRRRRLAYLAFQFGFLQLWTMLILIGLFLRGPNWEFFGPFEPRAAEAAAMAADPITLSHWFWIDVVGRAVPRASSGAGWFGELGAIGLREAPGIAILLLYFVVLPIGLAKTALGGLCARLGRGRYVIFSFLALMMLMLPVKMLLHWTCHLSYLVSVPEYFFNF